MCCLWPTHKCAAEMVQANTQENQWTSSSRPERSFNLQLQQPVEKHWLGPNKYPGKPMDSSLVWLGRNKELPVSCPGFCRVFLGPFSHCLLQLEKMFKTCHRPLLERRNISKSLRNVSSKVLNLYHKDLTPCEGKRGPNLVQARCS